ncbi:hypothetical protein AN478_12005 [Thiohalorhabdus denitrificans]|nr:hypothetical protein AN478_12005 [Thiohalorhabdus denitrificans]
MRIILHENPSYPFLDDLAITPSTGCQDRKPAGEHLHSFKGEIRVEDGLLGNVGQTQVVLTQGGREGLLAGERMEADPVCVGRGNQGYQTLLVISLPHQVRFQVHTSLQGPD